MLGNLLCQIPFHFCSHREILFFKGNISKIKAQRTFYQASTRLPPQIELWPTFFHIYSKCLLLGWCILCFVHILPTLLKRPPSPKFLFHDFITLPLSFFPPWFETFPIHVFVLLLYITQS